MKKKTLAFSQKVGAIALIILFIGMSLIPNMRSTNQYEIQSLITSTNNQSNVTILQNSDMACYISTDPIIEWIKHFGSPNIQNYAYAVRELEDEGYIIIVDCPPAFRSPWLIRTDMNGDTLWSSRPLDHVYVSGKDVRQTRDGGFIIAGESKDAVKKQILLMKTNETGVMEWYCNYGGAKAEYVRSVSQTDDGGYIIGGITSSYGSGDFDLWVIKTDANGTKQWDCVFGENAEMQGNGDIMAGVYQTIDGGYIIGGSKRDTSNPLAPMGWLIKIDRNGTELWNRTYKKYFSGTFYGGKIRDIQITYDGGYILAGEITPGEYPEAKGSDVWLIKTNPDGIEEWNQNIDDFGYGEIAYSVQQTREGGYVIAGQQVGKGYMMKTDQGGVKSWDYNFKGLEMLSSIQQTRDTGYIITGWTRESSNRDAALVRVKAPDPIEVTINAPFYGLINESIEFYGSATGGLPPTYKWFWEFGDGQTSDLQNPTHTYTIPGNYSIRLTVTDGTGLPEYIGDDISWIWIQKTNRPPDAPFITGPQRGVVGEFYNYTFQAKDPEGTPIYYYIEWGDGRTTGWLGMYQSNIKIIIPHYWEKSGRYTIRAKTKDVFDEESDWTTLEVRMPHTSIYARSQLHFIQRLITFRFLLRVF